MLDSVEKADFGLQNARMFQSGYILSRRDDLIWFIGLPFLAIGAALAMQHWLPAIAMASITLLITAPHHFVTWLRTYGIAEDRRRWKIRLIAGPAVLIALVAAGATWAPLTLALMAILWDHQHSVMQQYGFARIYDFKARTGGPLSNRFDLWLGWILYLNLLITAPLFTRFWVSELVRWNLTPSVELVQTIQLSSWLVAALFLAVYTGQTLRDLRAGYCVNPVKLLFISASYFLWYFTSWQTDSILVFGIAHRIMHGLQYIVIVYWYIRRKSLIDEEHRLTQAEQLVSPGRILRFVVACLIYAVAFQLLLGQPLERFGFGLVNFAGRIDLDNAYHVYAESVFSVVALTHYYFDSFIWKVREQSTQSGL